MSRCCFCDEIYSAEFENDPAPFSVKPGAKCCSGCYSRIVSCEQANGHQKAMDAILHLFDARLVHMINHNPTNDKFDYFLFRMTRQLDLSEEDTWIFIDHIRNIDCLMDKVEKSAIGSDLIEGWKISTMWKIVNELEELQDDKEATINLMRLRYGFFCK